MLQRCRAGRARRLSVPILIAALGFGAVPTWSQARDAAADALLAIDLNRSTVIERIVMQWGGLLLPSGTALDAEQLRTRLSGLRADRLLAASLAGTSQGLQQVLTQADAATRRDARLKSLGDAAVDLTYTPLTPCRIIDTRNAVGPLQPGVIRTEAGYTATTFAGQGGASSNCGISAGVAALALNVVAVNPANLGFIKLWPANAAQPNASTINYDPTTINIASGTIVRVDGANNNSFNAESPAQVQMVVDVVGYFKSAADATAMNFNVNGQRVMRYEYNATSPNVIGGHPDNSVGAGAYGSVIAGGGFPGSGTCVILGVTKPCQNSTGSFGFDAVGGGEANVASGGSSVVSGGSGNTASGLSSSVAGGTGNTAGGLYSAVAGGLGNTASASYSFAAGRRAKATTTGSFMWADSRDFDFQPSVNNFFGVRATGGVGLTIAIDPTTGGVTQFCNLLPPIASWSCTSDRDAKENFIAADGKDILQRLVAMPLFSWNFKGADPTIRSLGPTAQDFYAAFGLGRNDKSIANVNLEGVALAAIQGLHQLVKDKDANIEAQQRRIAELEDRVAHVESLRSELDAVKHALLQLTSGTGNVAMHGTQ